MFDEPDAGLDIVNLRRLSAVVTKLSTQQNKACITVSHNPFYIAQVANKVYRLQEGKLKLIADWPALPLTHQEVEGRQLHLQEELSINVDDAKSFSIKNQMEWPF